MKKIIKNLIRRNKYVEMLAYILQNNQILNSSGSGEFGNTLDEMYEYGIKVAELYNEDYKGNLKNKVVLEIGTGYTRVAMLHMIKNYGISRVYCYDRFNCLHQDEQKLIEKYNLSSYLDKLKYITGTNDEISKQIQQQSIDYIVSNAVLEHVDDLELLFKNLTYVIKDNGTMYHKVDLRCHNRFKNFGELYFHTFDDTLWKAMGSNIGQPNRKLLKNYINLFERFDLNYYTNILEEFSYDELEMAKKYLTGKSIKDYKTAIVEFRICQK